MFRQKSDDIVTRLLDFTPLNDADLARLMLEAADEIERLRAEVVSIHTATHQAMWLDTIIPIAEACGVGVSDEDGNPRRQFQMVEEIIKAVRGE